MATFWKWARVSMTLGISYAVAEAFNIDLRAAGIVYILAFLAGHSFGQEDTKQRGNYEKYRGEY